MNAKGNNDGTCGNATTSSSCKFPSSCWCCQFKQWGKHEYPNTLSLIWRKTWDRDRSKLSIPNRWVDWSGFMYCISFWHFWQRHPHFLVAKFPPRVVHTRYHQIQILPGPPHQIHVLAPRGGKDFGNHVTRTKTTGKIWSNGDFSHIPKGSNMIQFSSHSMIVRSENDRPKCNAQDILGLRVVQQKKSLEGWQVLTVLKLEIKLVISPFNWSHAYRLRPFLGIWKQPLRSGSWPYIMVKRISFKKALSNRAPTRVHQTDLNTI